MLFIKNEKYDNGGGTYQVCLPFYAKDGFAIFYRIIIRWLKPATIILH